MLRFHKYKNAKMTKFRKKIEITRYSLRVGNYQIGWDK